MRRQRQDAGAVHHIFDPVTCFRGKIHVAHTDQLVEQQDVAVADCRDREGEAHEHAARIRAQGQRKVIAELDIVDTTDAHHPRIAIPYTFVLDAERAIFKIYNGWWYVGRPTVDELRMDLRTLMSRRPDWWYGDTPAPYTQGRT